MQHEHNGSVLLFPGQGSQYAGMGAEWFEAFALFRHTLQEASEVVGYDVAKLCLTDPDSQLGQTEYTQPAILSVSIGVFRVLEAQLRVRPHLVAGHSLGEYSALVAAGGLSFPDALRLVQARAQAMAAAVAGGSGSMLAYVGPHGAEVDDYCRAHSCPDACVEVVNFNSQTQRVLSGHAQALARAARFISDNGLGEAIQLPVSGPFHSSLMRPAVQTLASRFRALELAPLECSLCANIDARLYDGKQYTPQHLLSQLCHPVLWRQSLQAMSARAHGCSWVEVGPGRVLSKLLRREFPHLKCANTESPALLDQLEPLSRAVA